MEYTNIPSDIKEQLKSAIDKIKGDRPKYFESIKFEIDILISMINNYDKVYILGALGIKLIKAIPNFHNQFLATYEGKDKAEISQEELLQVDDEIEVLLEYAMSIASATENTNVGKIPNESIIDGIYQQLLKIKNNMNFWELSADIPKDGSEFDHWLRTNIMLNSINVRGNGYHLHIYEIYKEIFTPHNGFLKQYYGFDAEDIYNVIQNLDSLVYSKIGNALGASESHKRYVEWSTKFDEDTIAEIMEKTGKHFIQLFTEENPDLYDKAWPDKIVSRSIDDIDSYSIIFWVIPKTDIENKIFDILSIHFGHNDIFFQPPRFKAFPLNDTLIKLHPLIKVEDKYYNFSLTLAFRNIFEITEKLLELASSTYYEHSFKGNNNKDSRDNYIEIKTKKLFEKMLPQTKFYHSLKYDIVEEGKPKSTELDILGISSDTIYVIEVKAGELNQKHRRGALKGLKDRINETINEGSYQCHRALKYITQETNPSFEYVEGGRRETLVIDKSLVKNIFKISVTFEHFSAISANLKYLVNAGILSPHYKWSWIVSLYDLMIFSDLIESEDNFKEYLINRIELYDRDDIEFSDEIDILGYYLDGNFPLISEEKEKFLHIVNYKSDIDEYYNRISLGLPDAIKPIKKK